jgi:hypothetical protein
MHGGWYDLDGFMDGETWVAAPTGIGSPGLWSEVTNGAGRMGQAAVIDPLRGRRMLVFGGEVGDPKLPLNDVQAIDLNAQGPVGIWAPVAACETPPSPRTEASAIYDPVNDQVVVFGGRNTSAALAGLYALRFVPPTTLRAEPEGGYRSADLDWVAPNGDVAEYDVRRSLAPITCSNFLSATAVSGEPVPGAPGTLQTFHVTGLADCRLYYFAMRTRSSLGVFSQASNCVSATTICSPGGPGVDPGPIVEADPSSLELGACHPNPASAAVSFEYAVPRLDARNGSLVIFDVAGRQVRSLRQGSLEPGRWTEEWDLRTDEGRRAPPGLYFLRIRVGDQVRSRTVLIAG